MNKVESTRMHILEKAFEGIYQNGYQATSVDKIIENTTVTKGAFYYHFKNKEAMGLAMIKEIIAPRLDRLLIAPLKENNHSLDSIYLTISNTLLKNSDFDIRFGCPINNLIQEMSPINDAFKMALQTVLNQWKKALSDLLKRGIELNQVDKEIDSQAVAEFIIVSYEGLRGTGKVYQKKEMYRSYTQQLNRYLGTLRC